MSTPATTPAVDALPIEQPITLENMPVAVLEQVRLQVRSELEPQLKKQYEAKLAQEAADFIDTLKEQNQKAIQQELEALKKSFTPLTPEEVAKLASQEYLEFDIALKIHGVETKKSFKLIEMPQDTEKRLFRLVKTQLMPIVATFQQMQFKKGADDDIFEKVKDILTNVEGGFDILASCTAICLDPYEEDSDINAKWVSKNLSTGRQFNIVSAQFEVQRLRDFFSNASQNFAGLKML